VTTSARSPRERTAGAKSAEDCCRDDEPRRSLETHEEAGPVAGTGLVTPVGIGAEESQPPLSPLPRQLMSGFQSLYVPSGLPCQIQACRSKKFGRP